MKIKKQIIFALSGVLIAVGCTNDDNMLETEEPQGTYENGILVSNEGPFDNGSGTITFISDDYSSVEDAIFKKENQEDLGNIVQSVAFDTELAYVVVNNSHKIHVVDRYSFKSVGQIVEGLNNPRYVVIANGKGYVTNWGDTADENDDFVAIVDLSSNSVTSAIPVVLGPEAITANGNFVYVAHQGAFGQNNQLSVIDVTTDTVSKTLTVGDFPNSMQWDASGNLWVLSGGAPDYTGTETQGTLSQIETSDNTVAKTLGFETTQHPKDLSIENEMLYFGLDNGVYACQTDASTLPTQPFIDGVSFYTMTLNDGKLYGTDAKDFASKGDLLIYDLASKEKESTISVGIIPGGIYFN